jgi:hypothetical protein
MGYKPFGSTRTSIRHAHIRRKPGRTRASWDADYYARRSPNATPGGEGLLRTFDEWCADQKARIAKPLRPWKRRAPKAPVLTDHQQADRAARLNDHLSRTQLETETTITIKGKV